MVKRGKLFLLVSFFTILMLVFSVSVIGSAHGTVIGSGFGVGYTSSESSDTSCLKIKVDSEGNVNDLESEAVDVDSGGAVFTLNDDLSCDSGQRGIYVKNEGGSDITLDCGGHSISGHGLVGVLVEGSGITVENCEIEGGTNGIYVNPDSTDITLNSNTISNSEENGIVTTVSSSNVVLYDNEISFEHSEDTNPRGINLASDDSSIDCNEKSISGHTLVGVLVKGSGITVENCVIEGGSNGIWVNPDSTDITLNSNTISNSQENGIYLTSNSASMAVSDNTISTVGENGIYVGRNSENIVLNNNYLCYSGINDLYCFGSADQVSGSGNFMDNIGSCISSTDADGVQHVYPSEGSYYSCYESSSEQCSDGVDNDLDGLVDCADEECSYLDCSDSSSCEGDVCACVENSCTIIDIPEAEMATADYGSSEVLGVSFSYGDVLTWFEDYGEVSYTEASEVSCSDYCSSLGKSCLFADAGRMLCSTSGAEKCTCI